MPKCGRHQGRGRAPSDCADCRAGLSGGRGRADMSAVPTAFSPSTPRQAAILHTQPAMVSPPTVEARAVEVLGAVESQRTSDLAALRLLAETYADYMQMRVGATNRMERGGVDPHMLAPSVEVVERAEKELERQLIREYRRSVPPEIQVWQKAAHGIGEHSMARLIGRLGHPRYAQPYHWEGEGKGARVLVADPPYERSISQLWSYCGVGDPTRRRRKGMTAEEAAADGSPGLRSLLHVMSECCIKQRQSPYRAVYDEARETYAERDWTDGHRHNAAMRKVAKEILRDLWLAADDGGRGAIETHSCSAASSAAA